MLSKRSTDAIEYISIQDEAVDADKSDRDEYVKTFDPKHIKIREGFEPTVFHLRRLTRAQFLHMQKQPEAERPHEAVAYGLELVTNFKHGTENVVLTRKNSPIGKRLDAESLDKVYTPDLFTELGAIIIMLSTLNPTKGQD